MNYLISFCVVTCDQPIELERLLNSMIKQDLDDIEIIIRDDSEGCESQLVVNKYSKTIPIRYYKMKKEGIDIAISYVVGVSRGLYVWLFGDDVLSRKSFNMLKDKLKSFDYPDFIYLNSSSVQNDNIKSISVKSDLISYDRNNFLLMIKDQLGFLSALVFNSKIISDAIKSDKSVVGTHWFNIFVS